MKRFGKLCLLMMVFSTVFIISCDIFQKNKLTRDKAKEIIIKDCFGGKDKLPAIGLLKIGDIIHVLDNDRFPLSKLRNLGFLSMNVCPPPWNYPYYNIYLLDKAKPYVLQVEEGKDEMSLFSKTKK